MEGTLQARYVFFFYGWADVSIHIKVPVQVTHHIYTQVCVYVCIHAHTTDSETTRAGYPSYILRSDAPGHVKEWKFP